MSCSPSQCSHRDWATDCTGVEGWIPIPSEGTQQLLYTLVAEEIGCKTGVERFHFLERKPLHCPEKRKLASTALCTEDKNSAVILR